MEKKYNTVKELFDALDGVTVVAELLCVTVYRVGMWQTRNKIQDGYLEVLRLRKPHVVKKFKARS